jgi:hypothetical protein
MSRALIVAKLRKMCESGSGWENMRDTINKFTKSVNSNGQVKMPTLEFLNYFKDDGSKTRYKDFLKITRTVIFETEHKTEYDLFYKKK